ncbi:retrovirus-related Pol polyprotein from transposon TNT 1-94 isoform X1 [Lactuca sativa]|uniref:retrovirus-related Pol polyprotein from transposon TNT 1-94 isoform X1 n=1 Tax=Lactuca sativa TaxID=4236 RepID=UPI0022AFACD7|nr:retrovirus-related Pol polyprotein from transposon TNT 1-94 isoform X1 [Lactuca sativa]
MLATMNLELQKSYEDMYPYEIHHDLLDMYHQSARQERYEIITNMITAKMLSGESLTSHLQITQRYVGRLLKLNVKFEEDLAIDITLHSLPSCYNQFKMTYHMNKEEVSLSKLQGLLRTAESNLKDKYVASSPAVAALVMAIGQGKGKKRRAPCKSHHKVKAQNGSSSSGTKVGSVKPSSDPKEAECYYCHEKGHWKRSRPQYLQDIKDRKIKPTFAGPKKK